MKTLIREKRKLVFEKKIISPNVIRDFAGIIDNEIKASPKKDTEIFAVFSIDANDNSSYESQSVEIFREGDILDKKGVVRITMRFNTRDYSKNIEIQLIHVIDSDEDSPGTESFILVSGDDPTWVNGILFRYNEIILLTEDQVDYKRFVKGSVFLALLSLNIIYFRVCYSHIEKIESGWISLLLILGPPFLSLGFIEKISDYIKSIWPDMEFQTGPDHLRTTSLKRKKLTWIVVTFLVPILIGIIYDLVKSNV